jgi:hypothetical protein
MQTILVTDFLRARNLFITVVCIFFQTKKIRTHVSDERVATEPATTTAEESEASRAPGSRSHGRRSSSMCKSERDLALSCPFPTVLF